MPPFQPEELPASLRISNPHPGIYAYYDGRTGSRLYSEHPNWLDDGAFVLGVATYSIVSGNEALIYDAHITPGHAKAVQSHLRGLGVMKITVVYSHHHKDHVAGASGFENCVFIAHEETARILKESQQDLAREDPPVVVILPAEVYQTHRKLQIGDIMAELHHFNIHTTDGTVLWLPRQQLLLVGDALEDTVTYLSEPGTLSTHEIELRRLSQFPVRKILPAHGSLEVIAAGGYGPDFIGATLRYIAAINDPADSPIFWSLSLKDAVASDIVAGVLAYWQPYERVHEENIEMVREFRETQRKGA